jgi:predicted neuraminidase
MNTIAIAIAGLLVGPAPVFESELIFPPHAQHNHAPGIVECPNGDLLVSWYRGSGERSADDVAVYGARRRKGQQQWSDPFLMADRPGFPDCNTAMIVDRQNRLWLFWPTILANSWESCITNYQISSDYQTEVAPKWDSQGLLLLRPEDFQKEALTLLDAHLESLPAIAKVGREKAIDDLRQKLGNKLYQRLGWQPRCKPTILPGGRILLPLYSDTFSISIMAISDDDGRSWFAGKPLIGFGNIQPAVLRRNDGTLVAYMRENGFTKRVRVAESNDEGVTWGRVGIVDDLPNPGSGLDGIRLNNGHWLLVLNDTESGRRRLAVLVSTDEGKTWPNVRYLEDAPQGSYHYPAVVQSTDGRIHVVYSYFVEQGKSMKHAAFDEGWVVSREK